MDKTVIREGRIPFEISVNKSERPNRRTIRAMKEGDMLIAAEDAPGYHSWNELKESLGK